MIDTLYELPGFFLEGIIIFLLYSNLTGTIYRNIKHPVISILSYACTGCIMYRIFPMPLVWVLVTLIYMFCLFPYAYRLGISDSILLYSICSCVIDLSEDIILTVLPISDDSLNNPIVQIAGESFILLLFFIICRLFSLDILFKKIKEGSLLLRIIIVFAFILTSLDVIMGKIDTINNLTSLPVIAAGFLIIFLLCALIVHQTYKLNMQKQELSNYYAYQPLLKNLTDDILARQHDFDNQLQALKMLPYSYKDYDSLSREIINYSTQVACEFQDTELLKINLKVLAGFLYSKVKQAHEEGKELNVSIFNSFLVTSVPEYRLIRMVGILVDNALEAIPAGGSATLQLDSVSNRITIVTINEGPFITDELQNNLFKKGYTTKLKNDGKKHGYGLSNLLEMTEEYSGEVLLENITLNGKVCVRFEVVV
jgi:two-component system sensor histidine kinase AgrC